MRHSLGALALVLALAASTTAGQPADDALVHQHWFEARTTHFRIYSCGSTQAVASLATRLEQFHDAYSLLAGAQAVASPPIIAVAFPDYAAMKPFLPLYQGQPENLAAFFIRGTDENLIVLHLAGSSDDSLQRIFHEYSHLLMRHNAPFWPMWLNEGMAEIYAPFEVVGPFRTRIGKPLEHHVELLAATPLMPLQQLFAVTRDSPEYNERKHQGIFYAESWLLAHYLMLGGNPALQAGFRQLTPLLRQGQSPEQAFTNALHTSLPAMEAQLRRYLAQGKFQPLELNVSANLEARRFTYYARARPGGSVLSPRRRTPAHWPAGRCGVLFPAGQETRPGESAAGRGPGLAGRQTRGSTRRPCAFLSRRCSTARSVSLPTMSMPRKSMS